MERNVRVNAVSDRETESASDVELGWQPVGLHGEWETKPVFAPPTASNRMRYQGGAMTPAPKSSGSQADQGPCLYFGPAGQRCSRRAATGGFCLQHQPDAIGVSAPAISGKKMAAIGVAIAMLWPEIVKVASALIRLIR